MKSDRSAVRAAGRRRRDRRQRLPLRPGRPLADGRSRPRLRRRPPAGRRHRPARPALHRGAAGLSRRAGPDPRPRGPSGRGALSVAAAALPDLVHAVHRRRPARASSSETDFARDVPIRIVEPGEPFEVGRLRLPLHPRDPLDPRGQRAGAGHAASAASLHTGDWKLDPAPLVGARTDADALEDLGKEGVLAMLCDSTNVLSPGTSGSEAEVRDSLTELIAAAAQPRRADQLRLQRRPARDGDARRARRRARAVRRRPLDAADDRCGARGRLPARTSRRSATSARPTLLPRHKVLYLCTGSQGEAAQRPDPDRRRPASAGPPRARRHGDLQRQDHPGQRAHALQPAQPAGRAPGIEVITEGDHFVHVSGHPCRDELEQMYRWIKPKIAVPVHGEARHLHAHQRLARADGRRRTRC